MVDLLSLLERGSTKRKTYREASIMLTEYYILKTVKRVKKQSKTRMDQSKQYQNGGGECTNKQKHIAYKTCNRCKDVGTVITVASPLRNQHTIVKRSQPASKTGRRLSCCQQHTQHSIISSWQATSGSIALDPD